MPPLAFTRAEPLLPPLQETLVPQTAVAISAAGWVIVADAVAEHPWASVTVTLYKSSCNNIGIFQPPATTGLFDIIDLTGIVSTSNICREVTATVSIMAGDLVAVRVTSNSSLGNVFTCLAAATVTNIIPSMSTNRSMKKNN